MTIYGVQFLNGLCIDIEASSKNAARVAGQQLSHSRRWPSSTVVNTWAYDIKGHAVNHDPRRREQEPLLFDHQ